jgi:hypothetical protein
MTPVENKRTSTQTTAIKMMILSRGKEITE